MPTAKDPKRLKRAVIKEELVALTGDKSRTSPTVYLLERTY